MIDSQSMMFGEPPGARVTLLRAPLEGIRPAAGPGEWYAPENDGTTGLALLPGTVPGGLACELVYDSGAVARATAHLLVVSFAVPVEALPVFDDWYDSEHSPLLLNAPSWLRIRRLYAPQAPDGELNCYVLHELADLEVLTGPDRDAATRGPKRAVVAEQAWYATSRRWRFTPYGAGPRA
ncbi:hypothetical protein [Luedemannella helvata]|uniref:hypothetical protein n=1 Tax=Luedemannella helvata TaxID=349315 RepID=UPI0031E1CEF5